MNLAEFKQRVQQKMFMTTSDATEYSYLEQIVPTLNEVLILIANGVLALRKSITLTFSENNLTQLLPPEVLSIRFYDTAEKNATYFQPTDNSVTVSKCGKYTFICDCLYPTIIDSDFDNNIEYVPTSIITAAVLYVASQLLADIDRQVSFLVRNEYELFVAQLDIDRASKIESFQINSRW